MSSGRQGGLTTEEWLSRSLRTLQRSHCLAGSVSQLSNVIRGPVCALAIEPGAQSPPKHCAALSAWPAKEDALARDVSLGGCSPGG